MTIQVIHDPKAQEFFAQVDGLRPVLQYRFANGVMTIVHTGVPAPLERRGIAAALTTTALEFARAQGWQVEPACSYARAFLHKHPEYAPLWLRPDAAAATEHDREHMDVLLDEALEESFPASDVPAIGGET